MRYQVTADFDCDPDNYTDHIGDAIIAILSNSLPYMVDNVDIKHYVYEDESDEPQE